MPTVQVALWSISIAQGPHSLESCWSFQKWQVAFLASVLLVLPAVLGVVEGRWAASEVGESLWTMSLEQLVVLVEGEEDVGCTGALHLRVEGEGALGEPGSVHSRCIWLRKRRQLCVSVFVR
jgi:hypothetical protein